MTRSNDFVPIPTHYKSIANGSPTAASSIDPHHALSSQIHSSASVSTIPTAAIKRDIGRTQSRRRTRAQPPTHLHARSYRSSALIDDRVTSYRRISSAKGGGWRSVQQPTSRHLAGLPDDASHLQFVCLAEDGAQCANTRTHALQNV